MTAASPLVLLSGLAPLLPLVVGLIFLARLGQAQRYLLGWMGLALLVQIIGLYFSHHQIQGQWLYHLYTPLEVMLVSLMYREWLGKWWGENTFWGIIGAFGLFALGNLLFFQAYTVINSHAILGSNVLYVGFALAFFFHALDNISLGQWEMNPAFWINVGILLYNAGGLLILGLTHWLFEQSREFVTPIWIIHSSLNILHYLLFTLGLWLKKPEPH
ncbi:MAG: hypothetical protein AAFR61_27495 [Bacteroidota bacterium]